MKKFERWLLTSKIGRIVNVGIEIAGYLMFFSVFGVAWVSIGVVFIGVTFFALLGFLNIRISVDTFLILVIGYAFLTTFTTLLGMFDYRLRHKKNKLSD
jgi:amino acid transporter